VSTKSSKKRPSLRVSRPASERGKAPKKRGGETHAREQVVATTTIWQEGNGVFLQQAEGEKENKRKTAICVPTLRPFPSPRRKKGRGDAILFPRGSVRTPVVTNIMEEKENSIRHLPR